MSKTLEIEKAAYIDLTRLKSSNTELPDVISMASKIQLCPCIV
jgi:hypothetical protein